MTEKILTIAVPAYNAQDYLSETIPTMAEVDEPQKLEIIIVNDGSTDNTLEEAEKLVQKYPDTVTILNKENGGHGSTINASIPVARGRYYKVVDADDWVDTNNLSALMNYLEFCDDDEVISPYIKVFTNSNLEEKVYYDVERSKSSYTYDVFLEEIKTIPPMHSKTTKTKLLQNNQILLDEKCFYVDVEFISFTIPFVQKISYFDSPIYRYRLGSATQSVNINSFVKNRSMHERVLFRLVEFYQQNNFSEVEEKYFMKLMKRISTTHAKILLATPLNERPKSELIRVENYIRSYQPEILKNPSRKIVRLLRNTNYVSFLPLSIFTQVKNKIDNKK